MKILIHAQTLVGIGHYFRAKNIANELNNSHKVWFLNGSRPLPIDGLHQNIHEITLEPVYLELNRDTQTPSWLQADNLNFYLSTDKSKNILDIFENRKRIILDSIEKIQPDVFLIDYFPFGRLAQKEELLPGIEKIHALGGKAICSVREFIKHIPIPSGLLTTQTDNILRGIFSSIEILNEYFDYLLIHGDPNLAVLEDHFHFAKEIQIPIHYTGYVVEPISVILEPDIKRYSKDGYVLVSTGAGQEGLEILEPCIEAWKSLVSNGLVGSRKMVIFAGHFMGDNDYAKLEKLCRGDIFYCNRFASNFINWVKYADFSISRAGYNTVMNVLTTATPALLLPSKVIPDQLLRAKLMSNQGLQMLSFEYLTAQNIAEAILRGLSKPQFFHQINLNGAVRTREILEQIVS